MRSPRWLAVASVVLSLAAHASELKLCDPEGRGLIGCSQAPRVQLADYHGAAPVAPLAPSPSAPVVRTSADFFLLGLGLAGAGLVLGGVGFAVLYLCREGTTCAGNTSLYIGWALAAPGVLPLVVGLAMMYFSSGGKARADRETAASASRWVLTAAPIPGGGMVGGGFAF